MIATHNEPGKDGLVLSLNVDKENLSHEHALGQVKSFNPSAILLPSRSLMHHNKAGINPLVDAAAYLFSIMGKVKPLKHYRHLGKLQKELLQEITLIQEQIKNDGYHPEYIAVTRYVLCATCDDVIMHTAWGGQGQWDQYSLLHVLNLDTQHHDKFFSILDRAVKDVAQYIDLMELMFICLNTGYKGQYRSTEHNQFQLEQITHNLYKHIRAFRGDTTKILSPSILKPNKAKARVKKTPLFFIFMMTASIIMTIFISLGYLMDVISNEAYKSVAGFKTPIYRENY